MFTFPVGHFSVARNIDPLSSVIASACFDLDATLLASTNGVSQVWKNTVTSPADGQNQADYDFFRGDDGAVATDDPPFNGSAGSEAAFFSMDGGTFFHGDAAATTTMKLLNELHQGKAGHAWWLGFTFFHVDPIGKGIFDVFHDTDDATIDGSEIFTSGATGNLIFSRRAASSNTNTDSGISFTNNSNNIILISRDEDTDSLDFWGNSKTVSSAINVSWSANTADAGNELPTIGSLNDTTRAAKVPNGFKFYGFYGGNEFLDDTKAGTIVDHIVARHPAGRYGL